MLFRAEHEHGDTQRSSNEHLDEHALRRVDLSAEERAVHPASAAPPTPLNQREQHLLERYLPRRQPKHDRRRRHAPHHLRRSVQRKPDRGDHAAQEEREAHVRVEQPAGGTEEEPRGDEQREAHACRDVHDVRERRRDGGRGEGGGGGGLDGAEAEEEEERRAEELEQRGEEVGSVGRKEGWEVEGDPDVHGDGVGRLGRVR